MSKGKFKATLSKYSLLDWFGVFFTPLAVVIVGWLATRSITKTEIEAAQQIAQAQIQSAKENAEAQLRVQIRQAESDKRLKIIETFAPQIISEDFEQKRLVLQIIKELDKNTYEVLHRSVDTTFESGEKKDNTTDNNSFGLSDSQLLDTYLKTLVSKIYNVPIGDISDSSAFENLNSSGNRDGWLDLRIIELYILIEEQTQCRFQDNTLVEVETFGELKTLLKGCVESRELEN